MAVSFRVEGAVLRGEGEVDHAGEDHVLVVLVGVEGGAEGLHILRAELAALLRQGQDLVAGELDGPGLVGADVAGPGAEDALPGAEQGVDDKLIGLGAAHEKADPPLRAGAGGEDLLRGAPAVGVRAVARQGFQVRLHETAQDLRMGPGDVVTGKGKHGSRLQHFFWLSA